VPGCHKPRPAACRPFVITPYTAGEDGALVPAMPEAGPCGERYERACVVVVDHVRKRSTGPCFPLTVVRCGTHRAGFTLYPPGHVPYGRIAVAPVAPDGRSSAEVQTGAAAFAGTMFEAALDAARGQGWSRECPGGSDRWWGTQGRRLEASIRVCGVSPQLQEPEREAQGAALRVELLLLREGASALLAAPGYRSRGQAVHRVLERLSEGPCVLQRLMKSGHLARLWGPPFSWDPGTARLSRLWFRGPGTDPE
jgi:hypothetical protein